ncbi:MAG: serine phosphatase RsbU (regulator of sigma subunit)/tetratricopeptide (TPR) repeat protein [Parvicellaceae bacterium]
MLTFCVQPRAQLSDNQEHQIDSLKQVIETAVHDTTLVNAWSVWDNIIYASNPNLDLKLNHKIDSLCSLNLTKNLTEKVKTKFQQSKGSALNAVGTIHYGHGDYKKAIHYFTLSLKIKERLGDKKGIAAALQNIGSIHLRQEDYEKALTYFTENIKIFKEINDQPSFAATLNNIGLVQMAQKKYPEAIESYTKSMKIREEFGDQIGVSASLNNLGLVYDRQRDFEKALFYHTKSLKIKEALGSKRGMATSMNNIGLIHAERDNYNEAILFGQKSLEIAQEIGSKNIIKVASNLLWGVNKKLGNPEQALEMYELYIITKDSLNSEENQKAIIRQEYKYKYEKQADSIAIEQLKKDELALAEEKRKEEIATKENEKKNLIIGSGSAGLGLVVLFTFFIINRLRKTRQQKDIIVTQKTEVEAQKEIVEKAHEQLEEKNTEIMDSIAYAKRIQSAIMPPPKLVKEYLASSFILYKPKDIVAGDFYWMEQKDSAILFAAADCTGHGVPGAMVSVICNNGLNRSVREHGLKDPGEILDKTREIVIAEFEKSEEEVKDGMDIALCSLDGNSLKYAGANNPLWIIRDGGIIETKANKQPIGKYLDPKPFTTHSIQLQKGDSIYIFSDGYVDQFGGEKGKKFKPANLRKLLLSIQDQSMDKQKVLLDEKFETWRGDLEQIDDVCMICVKV